MKPKYDCGGTCVGVVLFIILLVLIFFLSPQGDTSGNVDISTPAQIAPVKEYKHSIYYECVDKLAPPFQTLPLPSEAVKGIIPGKGSMAKIGKEDFLHIIKLRNQQVICEQENSYDFRRVDYDENGRWPPKRYWGKVMKQEWQDISIIDDVEYCVTSDMCGRPRRFLLSILPYLYDLDDPLPAWIDHEETFNCEKDRIITETSTYYNYSSTTLPAHAPPVVNITSAHQIHKLTCCAEKYCYEEAHINELQATCTAKIYECK